MFGDRGRYNFDMGHTYGEISVNENESVTELSNAAYVQITDFDTNGWSKGMTPDHSQNHITVEETGIYEAIFHAHAENDEAQSQTIAISLFAQNGTEEFENVHTHRTLAGGAGDIRSLSGGGFVELIKGETIELWAVSDSGPSLGVIFADVTLHLKRIDK